MPFVPVLVLLAGCAGADYSAQEREAAELREALGWGEPREALDPATLPGAAALDPPLEEELQGELTLERVSDLVVRRNPDVVAALERWVAFLERAPQRTALPNPTARYGYSSMFKMHTAEVMQEVPFPGKLLAEGRAALAEARGMRWELAERANLLREQAASSLAMLFAARRQVELLDENVELLARFIEIAQTKYAAGTATQSDVLRAQVERDGLRAERVGYGRDAEIAQSALNVLLDRAPDAPLGPVRTLPEPTPPGPLATLFAQAFQRRPELEASRARWAAEREMLSRAELEWVPDAVFGGAYVRDFGMDEDEVELTAGISLPIWIGRIRAGIREAEANVRRAEAETRSARNRVLDEVRVAASRLAAATEQHRIVRDDALPRAEQNVQVTEVAYTAGQVDFLDLIDAQRMRLTQQLELERTRAERSTAEAELRRALGEPGLAGGGGER
jgi:outer membrane protein TolC